MNSLRVTTLNALLFKSSLKAVLCAYVKMMIIPICSSIIYHFCKSRFRKISSSVSTILLSCRATSSLDLNGCNGSESEHTACSLWEYQYVSISCKIISRQYHQWCNLLFLRYSRRRHLVYHARKIRGWFHHFQYLYGLSGSCIATAYYSYDGLWSLFDAILEILGTSGLTWSQVLHTSPDACSNAAERSSVGSCAWLSCFIDKAAEGSRLGPWDPLLRLPEKTGRRGRVDWYDWLPWKNDSYVEKSD